MASPNANTAAQSAEGFIGSIFKYSISTFVNLGIIGLSMVLTGLFIPKEVLGQINIFLTWTNTIMTIAILGLDQALIRFYYEPPAGLKANGLFRVCFYFSSVVLLGAGTLCSTLLSAPIYSALKFTMVGHSVIPLLFLNAFFYMVARYFNVLYRMEGNLRLYTTESILMQFFYKLFYLVGAFLGLSNPVWGMVLCSVIGLGLFALVFSFLRRKVLRPHRGELTRSAYGTTLPYGLAIAPTAVFVTLNASMAGPLITSRLGEGAYGIYSYAYTLSNIVTMVQGGFASFWGPYMFANYRTQQPRIMRVHNYLNLVILCFFSCLVAFEDIIFLIFGEYAAAQPIFPLMMLAAVFTILCETTVYGNAIARRPIYDTIGIGLSFGVNVLLLFLLVPVWGLHGAGIAIAAGNFAMFLFRTFTAQLQYKSIQSIPKTVAAVAVALLVTLGGTLLAAHFWLKLVLCAAAIVFYCLLYTKEFVRLVKLALSMVQSLFCKQSA